MNQKFALCNVLGDIFDYLKPNQISPRTYDGPWKPPVTLGPFVLCMSRQPIQQSCLWSRTSGCRCSLGLLFLLPLFLVFQCILAKLPIFMWNTEKMYSHSVVGSLNIRNIPRKLEKVWRCIIKLTLKDLLQITVKMKQMDTISTLVVQMGCGGLKINRK